MVKGPKTCPRNIFCAQNKVVYPLNNQAGIYIAEHGLLKDIIWKN